MKIEAFAKNFTMTNALNNILEDKLSKIETYLENPVVRVILENHEHGNDIKLMFKDEGKRGNEVEMFAKDSTGKEIIVSATDEDMYVAMDKVINKLKVVLERRVDKRNSNPSHSIRYEEPVSYIQPEDEPSNKIVKRKQFDMKPMMEDEAVLQMELLGHQSFLFFNAETESMCMMYKRKDSMYGIIETL